MHRRIWKFLIATLVFALLVGAAPAMAAEGGDSLSGIGEGTNSLGATNQTAAAPTGDLIALDDLNISIRASDYVSVRQEEECVYIYTEDDGYIPYVMITMYDFTADDFIDQFTDLLASAYSDLQVDQGATPFTLGGGKKFTLVAYNYTISGYDATDIRLFREFNNCTYVFCTKVVPDLNMAIPNGYIESVAGSMEILAGGYSDYPLHVDSTHSIEPSLKAPTIPVQDNPSGDTNDGPVVSSSDEPVGGAVDVPDEGGYDGIVTFDPAKACYEGTWVEFQDGFKLYLPSDWTEYQLSDEDKAEGALYAAVDASESNGLAKVLVNWNQDSTVHSVADIKRVFQQVDGIVAEDTLLINGIPCATYATEDGTVSALMFFHPLMGEPYIFNVMVGDYSKNEEICTDILCSLSLAG